jgi:hypothetical protein
MCFAVFVGVAIQLIKHVPTFSLEVLLICPSDVWRRILVSAKVRDARVPPSAVFVALYFNRPERFGAVAGARHYVEHV